MGTEIGCRSFSKESETQKANLLFILAEYLAKKFTVNSPGQFSTILFIQTHNNWKEAIKASQAL